jgi:hypothetical protein
MRCFAAPFLLGEDRGGGGKQQNGETSGSSFHADFILNPEASVRLRRGGLFGPL